MDEDFDIEGYLAGMNDEQLVDATKEARDDLVIASREQPDSEWHSSCFAAVLIYSKELHARGLKLVPVQ